MQSSQNLFNNNRFGIIGTLKEADVKTSTRVSNGQEYVSVNAVISSIIGGVENEFEVSFHASRLTSTNTESQLYLSYIELPNLIGKKVDVSGSIVENRFWSKRANQIMSSQSLSGRFVRLVSDNSVDKADFEIGGFVVSTLEEKINKQGEVYRYDLSIGQSNYRGDSMSKIVLHIDPNQYEIINGVRQYNLTDTVKVNGRLNFFSEQHVVEEDSAFGTGVKKVYVNKTKNFFIEGGSPVITGEGAYSKPIINALTSAYKAKDLEIQQKAQTTTTTRKTVEPTEAETPLTSRQVSLI